MSVEHTGEVAAPGGTVDAARTGMLRLMARAGVVVYLLAFVAFFSVAAPGFLAVPTFLAIIDVATPLLVVSAAMTMCLVAAEVDLSVAGTVGLTSTTVALLLMWGWPLPLAILGAVLAGGAIGIVNGLLTARLVNVVPLFPSFLPTLAMYWVAIGIAEAFLPGQQAITITDPGFAAMFDGNLPAIYAVGTVVVVHLVMTRTTFGARLFAVGANRVAAAHAGVDVTRTKVAVLAVSGLVTGIAGVLIAGYFQAGYSLISRGIDLDAIAAAVIGGTALFGGRGNVLATLSGVLVLAVMDTGLLLMQVPPSITLAAKGALVIVAVAVDLFVRRHLPGR